MKQLTAIAAIAVLAASAGGAAAQDKPFEGVTLRVLGTQQPWEIELQKRAAEFTEMTGAEVQFDLFSLTQGIQKVTVELSSRSPAYDLVFVEASEVVRFAPAGLLEPLNPYIEAAGDVDIDDFLPATIEANTIDGEIYALPHFAATQMLYWRPDIFEEAGLDGPPETFAEMMEQCRTIEEKVDITCTAMRGKPSTSENIWYWTQILKGMGGSYVTSWPDDLTPAINSPEAIEAAEYYAELMNEHAIPGSVSASYDEVVIAMQQGNIAMTIEGAPLAGRILDPELSKVSGKLGFAVPPGGPAGTFAPFTSQAYGVNAASRNKEAAAAFLIWATGTDNMLDIASNSSFVAVTRNSVWEDPAFIESHGYDFGAGSFTQAYRDTLAAADPFYRLPIAEFRPAADRVGIALQEVVTGQSSAEDALNAANSDMERTFRRARLLP
ncbi:sugar ABC transporter substrate-binding protein [Martelella mediterranea]|uniref:ABC transporter substrate-binding protein n=1 Tax=Martelella mediterranea TaxID=293089 RepID=UPI001E62B3CC|nr:sugar ABC transporter substrate-binding protein [Martelella mediterranea]MCD1636424.1 sugar ABC transporter substrate-binding protein [Martelella mediterranea]